MKTGSRVTDYQFDDAFATPSDYAGMYRHFGLQVVPAHGPRPGNPNFPWKRPALSQWTEFQEALTPDPTFDRWYGQGGEYTSNAQMGLLTGRCSGNIGVIDLDSHKHPEADAWWRGLMAEHNNGMDLETAEQRTGGGGSQKLFRFPEGYTIPTNRTDIGVDIRGQGGFAMLPPSKHESGKIYDWLPGRDPSITPIAEAPEWLVDAIDDVVARHGGKKGGVNGHVERQAALGDFDDFGRRVDGRETAMRDLICGCLISFCGENGAAPTVDELHDEAWPTFERTNDATGKRDEAEFKRKVRYTLERFDKGLIKGAKNLDEAIESYQAKQEVHAEAMRQEERARGPSGRLILDPAEFLSHFTPPSYVVDGLFQSGYLYSLTAPTGHGKTAITLYLGQCIARGQLMHNREVQQGGVLLLAGENPFDVMARYLVLADTMGFHPNSIPFHFIKGVINIKESLPTIQKEAADIPNLKMVIVDTAAAYFSGSEDNDNVEKGNFARLLRELTFLPGKPTVVVCCHPVKGAGKDNLVPVGGGAFLNEVDGNAYLWKTGKITEFGVQGNKWRGPEFAPMQFELGEARSDAVIDAKGRHMPSVVARPVEMLEVEGNKAERVSDLRRLLQAVHDHPKDSLRNYAKALGWEDAKSQPDHHKVDKLMKALKDEKLVKMRLEKYSVTAAGKVELGVKKEDENDDF